MTGKIIINQLSKPEIKDLKKKRGIPSQAKVNEDIRELKKWLEQQHHLPKIDDELIYKFLFGCKYRLEETKLRLNNYYCGRARHARIFSPRVPFSTPDVADARGLVQLTVMPQTTKEGYRIICGILVDPDPTNYSADEVAKQTQACFDLVLRDEVEICSPGIIAIVSGVNVTVKHMMKWDLGLIKAVTDVMTKARPESIKGFHFIDCTGAIKPVFQIVASLLNSKIRKRISYNDPDVIFAQVPKDLIPNELGGIAGPMKKFADQWDEYLKQNEDWLMNEGSLKANLDLMPKDNEHQVFRDTFRKLDLD